MAAANGNIPSRNQPMHSHHNSVSAFPGATGFDFRGPSTIPTHGQMHGLPKIETQGLPMDFAGGLRTAPAFSSFPMDFSLDDFQFGGQGNTINPAQLHFGG